MPANPGWVAGVFVPGPRNGPERREGKTGMKRRIRRGTACLLALALLGGGLSLAGAEGREIARQGRYLALGFDDFRDSDFYLVLPMLERAGGTATFNRIEDLGEMTEGDTDRIEYVLRTGGEVGDHGWFHCNYYYSDPMFNGQDPAHPEGSQPIFPTDDQMRGDRGDGRNVFGFPLGEDVSERLWDWNRPDRVWTAFEAAWGELTDEQCQTIREHFSIYADRTGRIELLDEMSNRFLGTSGYSRGSWSEAEGRYTGGIFSGCATSCNHEIWERILALTAAFYRSECAAFQELYDTPLDFRLQTWSWPGSNPSPFVFEKDGLRYYDAECTLLYNYLARFPSSLRTGGDGAPLRRSWTDALREAGYRMTHDTVWPSRLDGQETPMMSRQLILNAALSRRDALAYSTNRTIGPDLAAGQYEEDFGDPESGKSLWAEMYDAGGEYRAFVEAIRQDTANGVVHGEVIDSQDTISAENLLLGIVAYCRETGVRMVSKADAYEVCFGEPLEEGNLIYNPDFRNTAKEFMPDAETVPYNPDGYTGRCGTDPAAEEPTLLTDGEARYLHCGIPTGDLYWAARVRGKGTIRIYAVRNRDSAALRTDGLELLAETAADSADFVRTELPFRVPQGRTGEFEPLCEGLGDLVMGVLIVMDGELALREPELGRPGGLQGEP